MNVTTITFLDNRSPATIRLTAIDTCGTTSVTVGPGQTAQVSMNVPWVSDSTGFPTHHMELQFGSTTMFWIWQTGTSQDGNHVRFSTDGAWHPFGRHAHGISAVDTLD